MNVAKIEELAKAKGLTIKSLEREAEISNGTIRKWETSHPRVDLAAAVARVLGTTVDELMKE